MQRPRTTTASASHFMNFIETPPWKSNLLENKQLRGQLSRFWESCHPPDLRRVTMNAHRGIRGAPPPETTCCGLTASPCSSFVSRLSAAHKKTAGSEGTRLFPK